MKHFIEEHSGLGLFLGCVVDIPRVYESIAHKDRIRKIMDLVATSKFGYGVIFDGAPSFAEAECVILYLVKDDLGIVDLVFNHSNLILSLIQS